MDVYCAWIDSANDANKRKGFGLVGGDDSDEYDAPVLERRVFKKRVRVREDPESDDEEYKEMPALEKTAVAAKKDPFSASDKIAELGLGRTTSLGQSSGIAQSPGLGSATGTGLGHAAVQKKSISGIFDSAGDDKGLTDKGKTDKPAESDESDDLF